MSVPSPVRVANHLRPVDLPNEVDLDNGWVWFAKGLVMRIAVHGLRCCLCDLRWTSHEDSRELPSSVG